MARDYLTKPLAGAQVRWRETRVPNPRRPSALVDRCNLPEPCRRRRPRARPGFTVMQVYDSTRGFADLACPEPPVLRVHGSRPALRNKVRGLKAHGMTTPELSAGASHSNGFTFADHRADGIALGNEWPQLSCQTGGGRCPRSAWVPAFAGKTTEIAYLPASSIVFRRFSKFG
jgi:hypothetical protein